jgi:Cupin domain
MHQSLESLPVTAEMPGYRGQWTVMGDLHFAYEHCAAGSNIDPLISIYPDHACPVEHWGYIFSGSVRVEFVDGHEEVFSAGDAFHVPPGHRPYMLEDTVLLQLTRRDDHAGMIAEMQAAGVLPG